MGTLAALLAWLGLFLAVRWALGRLCVLLVRRAQHAPARQARRAAVRSENAAIARAKTIDLVGNTREDDGR